MEQQRWCTGIRLYCRDRTESGATVHIGMPWRYDGSSSADSSVGYESTRKSLRFVSGSIRGPYCRYSRTLSATFPFSPAGIARVIDPCYWTPQLPFRYRVRLVWDDHGVEFVQEFQWGLRHCEATNDDLRFCGKRRVIRALCLPHCDPADLELLRDLAAAVCLPNPSAEFCAAASEVGVLVVANLTGQLALSSAFQDDSDEYCEIAVSHLSLEPAVQIVVASPQRHQFADTDFLVAVPKGPNASLCASDMWLSDESQLGLELTEGESSMDRGRRDVRGQPRVPQLAVRRLETQANWADMRKECDRLQRELAPLGQFAGYFISASDCFGT